MYVMTWTSDRMGVLLCTIIGMLFVLSPIYVPALGTIRTPVMDQRASPPPPM
jgi:hypothetical protein